MLSCDYRIVKHGKYNEGKENLIMCPECEFRFDYREHILKETKIYKDVHCGYCGCIFKIKIRKWRIK